MTRAERTAAGIPILICGYYGQGNLGDEAMLEGMRQVLTDAVGPVEPTVLSADPQDTARRHGLTAVPLRDGAGRIQRLRQPRQDPLFATAANRCFVLGGGDLLRDDPRWPVAQAWLHRLAVAQRFRRRCAVLGVSVGEIWKPETVRRLQRVLTADTFVGVRDEQSRDRLKALEVPAAVEVHPDLAFYGPNLIGCALSGQGGRRVGLSVRSFAGRGTGGNDRSTHDTYVRGVATIVDGLMDMGPDIEVHLLPLRSWSDRLHAHDDDYVTALQVAHNARHGHRAVVHRHLASVRQLADECASLDLMIGTRLHALVFSAANSVPVIAISYDPKVDGFMHAIGQERNIVAAHSLSSDLVMARADALLGDPASSRKVVQAGVRRYRRTGSSLVDRLRSALAGTT